MYEVDLFSGNGGEFEGEAGDACVPWAGDVAERRGEEVLSIIRLHVHIQWSFNSLTLNAMITY